MPKKTPIVPYENNPFHIAVNGLSLLFNAARGMAIFLFVLSLLSFYSGWSPTDTDSDSWKRQVQSMVEGWTTTDWFLAISSVLVIALALSMIAALIGGAASYTSAQLARGKSVRFGEAFHESFERLWSFLWLQVIMSVKLLLWSLLLVIPGIYMAFRYSLANVAFFDDSKQLRGNAAIKESLRLTKGAWITTFGANMLFDTITFGTISNLVTPGVSAVLYRQFNSTASKPKPHWLSILALGLSIAFVIIATIVLIVLSYSFS